MLDYRRCHRAVRVGLAAALLNVPAAVHGQQARDVVRRDWVGTWRGTLVAGPTTVRLALTVRQDSTGALTGSMKSETGAQAPAVIEVRRDTLRFTVAAEHISYVGTASSAGDSLRGTFSQGQYSFPLSFGYSASMPETVRPQDPKPPFPYLMKDVSIPSVSGVQLAGSVVTPEGAGPFPAVVFVTGSGPQDRDE